MPGRRISGFLPALPFQVLVCCGLIVGCSAHSSGSRTAGPSDPTAVQTTSVPVSQIAALPSAHDLEVAGVAGDWSSADRSYGPGAKSSCASGKGDLGSWTRGFWHVGGPLDDTVKISVIAKESPAAADAEIAERRTSEFQACFRLRIANNASGAGSVDPASASWSSLAPAASGVAYRYAVQIGNEGCRRHHDDYWAATGRYVVFADFGTCSKGSKAAEREIIQETIDRIAH